MGLLRGMARTAVVAGTATAVSGNVQRRQARREQAKYEEQNPQPAAAPAADTDDQIAQLEKLGALKDQGILTQAEFNEKKAQILGL